MANYYEILGVSEDSTFTEIRQAYRNTPKNNRHDNLVNEAYITLISPTKRSAYNEKIGVEKREEMHRKRQVRLRELSEAKKLAYKPDFVIIPGKQSSTSNKNSKWTIIALIGFILFLIYLSNSSSGSSTSTYVTPTPTTTITPKVTVTISPVPKKIPKTTNNATITPSIETKQVGSKIDCVGPDGKHMSITQKECDDFNNAWKPKATPTTQTSSCGNNAYFSYGYCYCNNGYTKNYSTGQCDPCPTNSYGSYGSCYCNDGYTKNYSTNQCEKLNCPSNSHESGNSCLCNDNYVKNYSNGQCEPCPANSTYGYGYCSCNGGYTKNYSSGQCDKI